MSNLADRYQPTRELKVSELNLKIEITGPGTPYLRKNGSLQKLGFLLTQRKLYIDIQDHTLAVGYWNEQKHNFDYTIKKQEEEK
jgi:hypothetical protein